MSVPDFRLVFAQMKPAARQMFSGGQIKLEAVPGTHKTQLIFVHVFFDHSGKILHKRASELLQWMEEIRMELDEVSRGSRGTVSIGVSTSCIHLFAGNAPKFLSRFPHVYLKVVEGNSSQLEELLVAREIEAAMMLLPNNVQEYEVARLPKNPYVLVVPPSWSSEFPESPVNLKDLANVPLLLLGRQPGRRQSLGESIRAFFHSRGLNPNIVLECEGLFTLLAMVRCGAGVSVLPRSFVAGFDSDCRMLDLADFEYSSEPAIVWLKRSYLSRAARVFIRQMTEDGEGAPSGGDAEGTPSDGNAD